MDEIESTERIIHHGYDVVLLKHGSSVNGVKDFLEIRLDVLHDKENLLEAVKVQILVFVQLLLDSHGRF